MKTPMPEAREPMVTVQVLLPERLYKWLRIEACGRLEVSLSEFLRHLILDTAIRMGFRGGTRNDTKPEETATDSQ